MLNEMSVHEGWRFAWYTCVALGSLVQRTWFCCFGLILLLCTTLILYRVAIDRL